VCHETHPHPCANMHIFVRQICIGSSFIYFSYYLGGNNFLLIIRVRQYSLSASFICFDSDVT